MKNIISVKKLWFSTQNHWNYQLFDLNSSMSAFIVWSFCVALPCQRLHVYISMTSSSCWPFHVYISTPGPPWQPLLSSLSTSDSLGWHLPCQRLHFGTTPYLPRCFSQKNDTCYNFQFITITFTMLYKIKIITSVKKLWFSTQDHWNHQLFDLNSSMSAFQS